MNKNFNEWYIENEIHLLGDGKLLKRWEGVEEYKNALNESDILSLVKLFFGLEVDEEYIEKFCSCFNKYDESFSKKSIKEIALLAGVILLETVQGTNYFSYTELLVNSTMFGRNLPANANILKEIQHEFIKDTDNLRSMFDMDKLLISIPDYKGIEEIEDSEWATLSIDEIKKFAQEVNNTFNEVNKLIDKLHNTYKIRYEESQLLWWLNTHWSTIKNCTYKSLKKNEACMLIGYEVAEMVEVFPGPYCIDGIFSRMLDVCKGASSDVAFAELIQSLDEDFKNFLIKKFSDNNFTECLPLTTAVKYAHNTSSKLEWANKFEKEIHIDSITEKKFSPLEYAKQFYYEILVQKCYTDLLNE